MSRRYDFQDILRRFQQTQDQRFRELSDAVARRILELLGGTTVPEDPPDAPSGLTATDDQEFQITLDWNPVATATGYNVYRSPVTENNFALIGSTPVSDYVDTGLPADTSFDYYVTAYNGSGESEPSQTETGTSIDGSAPSLPDTPANFRTTSNENQVVLAWDAFTGGTIACRIERSVDQLNWTVVANTSTLTFTDTNVSVGQTFYYRAFGVNATGVTSPATATLTVTVVDGDTTAPPVPVLLSGLPANKMISVTWEGVVAPDLAGYEIGWGTTSGVYTNTSALITGTQGNITGLTNGTRYYFAVRSVDTSLNENKSAWSNESNELAIDTADPGTTPDPPTAPTGLASTSPEVDTIRVTFTPGGSDFLERHRLYARVKPGQTLSNGQVIAPNAPFTQIDQELQPATELGKDVTIFVGSLSHALSPVTWQFYVTAVDTYNQESPASEIIEDIIDGAEWAQGPGGGPIGGQNINGDTGLGPDHKVPGFTFDFAIDVSDTTQYTGDAMERAAAIFNNRRNLPPSNPDFIQLSTDDTAHIAILLPTETVNKRLAINTGQSSSGGAQPLEAANFDFGGDPGFASKIELHFVGPWAQGDDTYQQAQLRMRDDPNTAAQGYKRTFKDADNKSLFADGSGADIVVGDITRQNAEGAFYFWNWDVEVASKDGIRLGSAADEGADFNSHNFDVIFGLSRIHQDAIEPNSEKIGTRGITAYYIRPTLIGCFVDLPWQSGSAVFAVSPMRGSWAITNTRFARAGKSALETYTRATRDSGLPQGTAPGTLQLTGVRHWDNWSVVGDGIGRAAPEGVAFFDIGGIEQDVTFTDCHVIEEKSSNFRRLADWPPGDPYDWRVYTAYVRQTNSALRVRFRGGERALASGYRIGAISLNNCLFYSKVPIRPVVDIDHGTSVTLTSVGAFTDEQAEVFNYDINGVSTSLGDSSLVGYRYGAGYPALPGGAPNTIGNMSATGLNTTTMRNTLASSYSLDATKVAVANADIVFQPLTVDHFEVTEDHSFISFTPPSQAYYQPFVLSPDWPQIGATDVLALWDSGVQEHQDIKDYFNSVINSMRANRAPRVDNIGTSHTLYSWTYWPNHPVYNTAATGDMLISFDSLGPDRLTGTYTPTNPTVDFEDNYRTLVVRDRNFIDADSQRIWRNEKDYSQRQNQQTSFAGSNGVTGQRYLSTINNFEMPDLPDGQEWCRVAGDAGQPTGYTYDPSGDPTWDPTTYPVMGTDRGGLGCTWRFENLFFEDRKSVRKGEHEVKWHLRLNNIENAEFVNCDFGHVHEEHAVYFNSEGDASFENCTWRYVGSQGIQLVNRSDNFSKNLGAQWKAENARHYNGHGDTTIRNCHFVDTTCFGFSQNPSSNVNLYNRGYQNSPASILVENSSFIQGMTDAESLAERVASGDPDPIVYTYREGNKKSFAVFKCLMEAQGGTVQEGTYAGQSTQRGGNGMSTLLFHNPFAAAAAARSSGNVAGLPEDDAATSHSTVIFRNCFFYGLDPAGSMFGLETCHTILFENCVIVHNWRDPGASGQATMKIDGGLSAYCTPGGVDYMPDGDLHATHNLIFRNCRGYRWDANNNVPGPMRIRWEQWDGTKSDRIVTVDLEPDREVHLIGFQNGREDIETAYEGPVRPGYMP